MKPTLKQTGRVYRLTVTNLGTLDIGAASLWMGRVAPKNWDWQKRGTWIIIEALRPPRGTESCAGDGSVWGFTCGNRYGALIEAGETETFVIKTRAPGRPGVVDAWFESVGFQKELDIKLRVKRTA